MEQCKSGVFVTFPAPYSAVINSGIVYYPARNTINHELKITLVRNKAIRDFQMQLAAIGAVKTPEIKVYFFACLRDCCPALAISDCHQLAAIRA